MPDDLALDGYKELSRKLSALGQKVGGKVLRGSMMRATSKVVREMKSKAPVGTVAHRTYKGRLVAPGFGSRSIKRVTRIKDGYASLRIGVRREAFYLIQFKDARPGRTPYQVSKRGKRRVKPYAIAATPWFSSVFEKHADAMTRDIGKYMGNLIEKAAKQ